MILAWITGANPLAETALILGLALTLDLTLGDPPWLYRALPHPIALIGRGIERCEGWLYQAADAPRRQVIRGGLLVLVICGLVTALGGLISWLLGAFAWGWLLEAALASLLLAGRSLYDHTAAVARGLDQDLEAGQEAVAHVVGRDPKSLDEAGVARAACESLAENYSDGLVAPAFWFLLFGLPGLCFYKAVNTLDSMIGHKSERYVHFGRIAAQLDDGINWIPARLAGGFFVLAALFMADAKSPRAWRTMRRNAGQHRSPNAGWPEAALAGALGFALAGPRRYGAEVVQDSWMGSGRSDLGPDDIRSALGLYLWATGLLMGAVLLLWVGLQGP